MSAAHVWDMLRLCWVDVYNGPPEIIVHGAGTNFDSIEFWQNINWMANKFKCIPTEAPQSIEILEWNEFDIVQQGNIPQHTRICGSSLVDNIKHEDTLKALEKSRLVVQAFKGAG